MVANGQCFSVSWVWNEREVLVDRSCSLWLIPLEANAVEVFASDDLTVGVDGYGRAGYRLVFPDEGPTRHGPELLHARIGARATYRDHAMLRLQLDASNGNARLLDAELGIELGGGVVASLGRFRAPASLEFMISAPTNDFAERALVSTVLPRRGDGVMVSWYGRDVAPVRIDAGAFVPGGERSADLRGPYLLARALVEPLSGLELHLSYTHQVDRPNATDIAQENRGQAVDFAVHYRTGGFHVLGEVVAHLDDESEFGSPVVASLLTGYRFDCAGDKAFRLVFGADYYTEDDIDRIRARFGHEVLALSDRVRIAMNYTMTSDDTVVQYDLLGFAQVRF